MADFGDDDKEVEGDSGVSMIGGARECGAS